MQGRKNYTEKLLLSFRLSDRIPRENLYRMLRETLDLSFLYKDTKELYGKTGNPSIDPVVFFRNPMEYLPYSNDRLLTVAWELHIKRLKTKNKGKN